MKIREMTIEELELLSFTDMAYKLIKEDGEPKTTIQLFKDICDLLELTKQQYEEKIADFFTSLTTDKRFILINSVNWDLKANNSSAVSNLDIDDDIDEAEDELEEIKTEEVIEDGDLKNENLDDIDEDNVDDFKGLEIIEDDSELDE